MAINKKTTTQGSAAQPLNTDATGTTTTDGKVLRALERACAFVDIIGQDPAKPKRLRGRRGGEQPKDKRHRDRREGVRDRVAARRRAEEAYTMAQIEGVA